MRSCCLILFTFCAVIIAGGSEGSEVEAEFPFELRDGFIWVTAIARESPAPLNFILDSGAVASTMDASSAARLGLRGGERVTVNGVGSSTAGVWPQHLNARIGSVRLPKSYLVVDLGHLQASCQRSITGLIGADFFQSKIVQIDFTRNRIRLFRSATSIPGERIELRKRRGIWQVPLSVNGLTRAWFRLDTGCASALQWVVTGAAPKTTSSKVTVALTEMSLPTTETRVTLGATNLGNLPTTIHRSEIFAGESGLAGVGLLSRFAAVTLDARADCLILTPVAPR